LRLVEGLFPVIQPSGGAGDLPAREIDGTGLKTPRRWESNDAVLLARLAIVSPAYSSVLVYTVEAAEFGGAPPKVWNVGEDAAVDFGTGRNPFENATFTHWTRD